MLVASYFLNKVICTRNILETYLGDTYQKSQNFDF